MRISWRSAILGAGLLAASAGLTQSPIDSARYLGISTVPNDPISTSPATILDSLLPLSERPSNSPPGDRADRGRHLAALAVRFVPDRARSGDAGKSVAGNQ